MTPEVEEDILDLVNETHGISIQQVPVQVCVTNLTAWRVLQQQQLYPYQLQRVWDLSLQAYVVQVIFM